MITPPIEKYYPCAIHEGMDDLESLSERIASKSSISEADCFRIVMSLTKEIEESFGLVKAEGRKVKEQFSLQPIVNHRIKYGKVESKKAIVGFSNLYSPN